MTPRVVSERECALPFSVGASAGGPGGDVIALQAIGDPVHKITERQVTKKLAEFKDLTHVGISDKQTWQHVIAFEKRVRKK